MRVVRLVLCVMRHQLTQRRRILTIQCIVQRRDQLPLALQLPMLGRDGMRMRLMLMLVLVLGKRRSKSA